MNTQLNQLINYKIFKGLTEENMELFKPLITIKEFSENNKIIEENETGDSLLFLLEGDISITKALTLPTAKDEQNDNSEKELIRLKAEYNIAMGELSLFSEDKKRTATVKALTKCKIGYLTSKDFFNVCNSNKDIGYIIVSNIANIVTENLIKSNRDVLKLTTAFSLVMSK